MQATYISQNSFLLYMELPSEILIGRRIKANCGDDGTQYGTILTSEYDDTEQVTTVTIAESVLTENLYDILFGDIVGGDVGSIPVHDHTGNNQGGFISSGEASSMLEPYNGNDQMGTGVNIMEDGQSRIWNEIATGKSYFISNKSGNYTGVELT